MQIAGEVLVTAQSRRDNEITFVNEDLSPDSGVLRAFKSKTSTVEYAEHPDIELGKQYRLIAVPVEGGAE